MVNVLKNNQKDNTVDYWIKSQGDKFIIVEDINGETYKLKRDSFENYLEDIGKIGQWFCDYSGDSGEITYDDFYQDSPSEVDNHIDHYMKNDFFPPMPKSEYNYIIDATIWDRVPMPVTDTLNGFEIKCGVTTPEEKQLLNSF